MCYSNKPKINEVKSTRLELTAQNCVVQNGKKILRQVNRKVTFAEEGRASSRPGESGNQDLIGHVEISS